MPYWPVFSKMLRIWPARRERRSLFSHSRLTYTKTHVRGQTICHRIRLLLARTSWTRLRMTNMDGVGNAQIKESSASIGICSQRDT